MLCNCLPGSRWKVKFGNFKKINYFFKLWNLSPQVLFKLITVYRDGVVITPRQDVAITSSTQNWSGNGFYNTNHSEIGAGMNFITPSTPKSTWCYNHPLLYVLNDINHSKVISSVGDRKILPKNFSSRLKNYTENLTLKDFLGKNKPNILAWIFS